MLLWTSLWTRLQQSFSLSLTAHSHTWPSILMGTSHCLLFIYRWILLPNPDLLLSPNPQTVFPPDGDWAFVLIRLAKNSPDQVANMYTFIQRIPRFEHLSTDKLWLHLFSLKHACISPITFHTRASWWEETDLSAFLSNYAKWHYTACRAIWWALKMTLTHQVSCEWLKAILQNFAKYL